MAAPTNSTPLVSVVVLAYNQEHTVGQAIESILNQKVNFPIEIIVGEDASPTDRTRAVCERYAVEHPSIVRLLPKAPNKGVVRNYADCIAAAKGTYLSGCGGDDWWSNPDKLQMQVDFLESHPDYGVVHTDMDLYNTDTQTFSAASGTRCPPEGWVHAALYKMFFVNAPTTMIRRDLMRFVDFDKFTALGFKMEDYPMWLELSRHTKFHFINQATITYRVSSCSISHSDNIEGKLKFIDATKQIQDYFYALYNPTLEVPLAQIQGRMYYMTCLQYKAYRSSFAYVDRTGFPPALRAFLHTYLGAWLCAKYLSSARYKKQKRVQ